MYRHTHMKRVLSKPLQGSLNLLILRTLANEPMHGYAITSRIQQVSDDVLQVEEGSLYPALHRLEQDGIISSEWKISETNRRVRFYTLTPRGRKQLGAESQEWEKINAAIAKVLRFA
jgi:PadR family transcriptional regulator PadR